MMSAHQAIGISLGSSAWARCSLSSDNSCTYVSSGSSHIAPAALLPRFSGEPIRFDTSYPSHARGAGWEWPLEARISLKQGCGRFPLAAAWTGRTRGLYWSWEIDGQTRYLSCIDAISAAYRELTASTPNQAPLALVIPNDFRQEEQQRIIDECNFSGRAVSLIWLPVAALLAWQKRSSFVATSDRTEPEVLVIHADWGRIHCTRLRLVKHFSNRVLPARMRASDSDITSSGFGWSEKGTCPASDISTHWQNLFASPDILSQQSPDPLGSCVLKHIANWDIHPCSKLEAVEDTIQKLSNETSPCASIVLGDFGDTFAETPQWKSLESAFRTRYSSYKTFLYGGLWGEKLVSEGASIFAAEKEANVTSYLDTLPQLELFVDRVEQYEWLGLLGDFNYVEGGKEWKRATPVTGLHIPKGSSTVKLVVAHDEYSGVRELTASLPNSVVANTPVILNVSCTPAQGNARLQLDIPANASHPANSILASWQKMLVKLDDSGREIGKEDYLNSQPRSFPDLLPRKYSHSKWNSTTPFARMLLEKYASSRSQNVSRYTIELDQLKEKLRSKDLDQSPFDATAIGSDAIAPTNQLLLDNLVSVLNSFWRNYRSAPQKGFSLVIRCLGYISATNDEFEDWLTSNLDNDLDDRQCVLHTCGLSLRNPFFISRLFSLVFSNSKKLVSANELKAISQILRYRSDATLEVHSTKCYEVIEACLSIFEAKMLSGGRGYDFRWASLIIVYMLRRRKYDNAFFDPLSELAQRSKGLFHKAIQLYSKGELSPLGGSVDLPAAMQQMIDYIDRKGAGDVLMARDDKD